MKLQEAAWKYSELTFYDISWKIMEVQRCSHILSVCDKLYIQIYEFHEYRNVAILNSSMIPDWIFPFFQQKYVPPVCAFVFR